ncbi:MAG: type II toxin-antitoxin system RelE family toxin [Vulcanimicrobiaceae bacterium]
MSRRVELTRAAMKDIQKLGVADQRVVVAALEAFSAGTMGDVKKLRGYDPPAWRLRVGRFRVVYRIEGEAVIVDRISDRHDVYR